MAGQSQWVNEIFRAADEFYFRCLHGLGSLGCLFARMKSLVCKYGPEADVQLLDLKINK